MTRRTLGLLLVFTPLAVIFGTMLILDWKVGVAVLATLAMIFVGLYLLLS